MKGSLEYIINKNLKNWRNPIFLSWKIIKKCVLHGKTQNFRVCQEKCVSDF